MSHSLKMAAFHDSLFSIVQNICKSNSLSNFNSVCGRLHGLIRACISGSHDFNVEVPFK